jgi:hypothetical protein
MGEASSIISVLILLGRPASGKSEIIDYLKHLDSPARRRLYHLGELEVLDDFPMLWSWFEEDRILEEMGKPRLHTTADGYFLQPYLWDLLIRRLDLEYEKLKSSRPRLHENTTVIIEFSRGSGHGGYRRAFEHLSPQALGEAAVLYVRVSFAESLRKNRLRFNPRQAHSILEHSLPEDKMRRLYSEDDWQKLSSSNPEFLDPAHRRLPYTVFENEHDLTTRGGEPLGRQLQRSLDVLWRLTGAVSKPGSDSAPGGKGEKAP